MRNRLFVATRYGIDRAYGEDNAVQWCRNLKVRNVCDHRTRLTTHAPGSTIEQYTTVKVQIPRHLAIEGEELLDAFAPPRAKRRHQILVEQQRS